MGRVLNCAKQSWTLSGVTCFQKWASRWAVKFVFMVNTMMNEDKRDKYIFRLCGSLSDPYWTYSYSFLPFFLMQFFTPLIHTVVLVFWDLQSLELFSCNWGTHPAVVLWTLSWGGLGESQLVVGHVLSSRLQWSRVRSRSQAGVGPLASSVSLLVTGWLSVSCTS